MSNLKPQNYQKWLPVPIFGGIPPGRLRRKWVWRRRTCVPRRPDNARPRSFWSWRTLTRPGRCRPHQFGRYKQHLSENITILKISQVGVFWCFLMFFVGSWSHSKSFFVEKTRPAASLKMRVASEMQLSVPKFLGSWVTLPLSVVLFGAPGSAQVGKSGWFARESWRSLEGPEEFPACWSLDQVCSLEGNEVKNGKHLGPKMSKSFKALHIFTL